VSCCSLAPGDVSSPFGLSHCVFYSRARLLLRNTLVHTATRLLSGTRARARGSSTNTVQSVPLGLIRLRASRASTASLTNPGISTLLAVILIKEHRLSDRQAKALGHIMEHARLAIQDFERLFPEVNRRSLQRDLKAMVDMGLLVSAGSTNKLVYRMNETG
jgi:hypothetical protein